MQNETEKKYWLVIGDRKMAEVPQTRTGLSALFKRVRKSKSKNQKKIFSSRHEEPIWESGPWHVLCSIEF